MAMFAGSMFGASLPGLITPLLGMIPQASGGPANPFAPTGAGTSAGATSVPAGMLGLGTQLYDQYGQPIQSKVSGVSNMYKLDFLKNPQMLLIIGGAVLVVILLK